MFQAFNEWEAAAAIFCDQNICDNLEGLTTDQWWKTKTPKHLWKMSVWLLKPLNNKG